MKMLHKGLAALRQNRRRGVSLIIAMCAAAVLLGLALSLVYSASIPLTRASRRLDRERCYQLAKSFSEVLDAELRHYTTDNLEVVEAAETLIGKDGSFYFYANELLEGVYGEYDSEHPERTSYYFSTAIGEEGYGSITVRLRKQKAENYVDPTVTAEDKSFLWIDRASHTKEAETISFITHIFFVDVTAKLGNDSYTYTTEYYRKDSYRPIYRMKGEVSGLTYGTGDNDAEKVLYSIKGEFYNGYPTKNKTMEELTLIQPQYYWFKDGVPYRDADGNLVPAGLFGDPPETGYVRQNEKATVTYTYVPTPEMTTYKRYLPAYMDEGGATS